LTEAGGLDRLNRPSLVSRTRRLEIDTRPAIFWRNSAHFDQAGPCRSPAKDSDTAQASSLIE